jgi:protocatechuate 3,4-dioxygenase beta subunit
MGGKDINLGAADLRKPGLVLDVAPGGNATPIFTGTASSQRANNDSTPTTPQAGFPADKYFASFKIQVSTADGPARPPAMAYWHTYNGDTSEQAAHMEYDGSFPLSVASDARSVSLAIAKPGYATLFAGPFTPPIPEKLDALHPQLTRGYSASVRVLDAAGQPVAGAKLTGYYPGPPEVYMPVVITDGSGVAAIEHIGSAPLNMRVRAEGFQADEVTAIPLDAAKPYRWTLAKALPLPGVVISSPAGEPIAGAKIKLAAVRGPYKESYFDPPTAPVLATTDAAGHFVLSSLRPDSRYFLFVEAPGHAGVLLSAVKTSQPELKVALGPELFVHGKVIHIEPKDCTGGKVDFWYSQSFQAEREGGGTNQLVPLQPKNGEADFVIGPLYNSPVDMGVFGSGIQIEIKDLPKSGVIIDLAPALAQK